MRLWSIHPCYLDARGLVALWREGLLAKKCIEGKTKGYMNHPQLERFKNYIEPIRAIDSYLYYVYLEGSKRKYRFDIRKINTNSPLSKIIPVSQGQLEFEFIHLCNKLKIRAPNMFENICKNFKDEIIPNPIFYVIPGEVEEWEKYP
jgi:hypothetical protein